jgi:uncharacterized protein
MLPSAFFIGLLGSLHCVGMCGPLSLLLPPRDANNAKFVFGRILYNLGRITTYSILGATVGFFGEKISFFIGQKSLSITIGILILTFLFLPKNLKNRINNFGFIYSITNKLKTYFGIILKSKRQSAQFVFGLINGLLPCGLIFAALAGAFLMSHWWEAALFMALFGFGTMPLMLTANLSIGYFAKWIGKNFKNIVTISYASLAIWMLVRGFQYDKFSLYTPPGQEVVIECENP